MQQEELQEIIEYIPNEGEPVLISGPKPLHKSEKPSAQKEDYMMRSMDLDNAFMEERGKGVIEDNEVLVRGEWKQPQEATEEEEEEEEEEENEEEEEENNTHHCAYCGKSNVTWDMQFRDDA